jgi:hypothetical protein
MHHGSRRRCVGRDGFAMLGSIIMKKIAFVLAAASLMSVAACNRSPQEAAADNVSDNLEVQADNLQAAADNAATPAEAAALTNASENVENQADAVENNVENTSM